jgi:ABC-type amino acid transport substrate-binding protein
MGAEAGAMARRAILIAAITALVVSLLASWAMVRGSSGKNGAAQTSAYQEIRSRGTLRAGYFVGAPYFTIDPQTNAKGGIFYEITERAARRLGLRVEWVEEVGFGEMAEGLRARRFDVVASGIWISPDRAREADFSIPLLFDAVFPYARATDHRFDNNLASANDPGVQISTIDGEMAATIALADFPRARTLSLPQTTDFTQMILNVTSGRADITFLALGPAQGYLRANPGQIRNLTPDRPTRVFPTAIMLPSGEYMLKRALDLTLQEMLNNGEIESIIRRFEETPGAHLRVALPYMIPSPAAR